MPYVTMRLVEILKRMGDLLAPYDPNRSARLIQDADNILARPELAATILGSNNYWGGAGSHLDYVIVGDLGNPHSIFRTTPSRPEPNLVWAQLLLDLASEIELQKITNIDYATTSRIIQSSIKACHKQIDMDSKDSVS